MSVTVQSDIQNLLKRNYRDIMVDSIYQDVTLFDMIPKYSGDVRGEDVRQAVELTRSHGGGARGAGEFLPVDYPESFEQSSVTLKRFYYTISIDGFAIELFKKGVGAFTDYLDLRMRNAQRDASHNLNRICHMDGYGVLGVVNGASTTTEVTLKHVWPNGWGQTSSGAGATSYSFGALQFLEEGDSISFQPATFTGATPALSGTRKTRRIESMNWDDQTITLDSAVTLADGELVFYGDSHSHSWNKEPMGLRGLVANTGTVQGINTATYRRWRSTIVDKSAAPIPYDWTHVTRIVSGSLYKGSSGPQNIFILCHPAMLEEHQRLVDPDLRYEPTDFKLNKGLESPVFTVLGRRVPVRTSIHMGYQELLALNTAELERFELAPMDWDDRGGELKAIQGKDSAFAFLKYYFAIAAKTLNHFARFDGVQVDTEYVKVIQETS